MNGGKDKFLRWKKNNQQTQNQTQKPKQKTSGIENDLVLN